MAWWMTVYCQQAVSNITGEQLLDGINDKDRDAPAGIDYYTCAEFCELDDEAAVDDALKHLRIVSTSDKPLDFEVRYAAGESKRPVVLHLWSDASRIAEELEEAEEGRNPPAEALERIKRSVEIVAIELGASQLSGDMGIVLAIEIARFLAQKGEGTIADDDDEWFYIDDNAAYEVFAD